MSEIYKSKREIFRDYNVAVKFQLRNPVHPSHYEKFIQALQAAEKWTLEEFSREVEHLNSRYPISVGLFVDIPVENEDGKTIGIRSVLLEHETGPEFFLFAVAACGWLGGKVLEKISDITLERLFSNFIRAIREHWPEQAIRWDGNPFAYVEIRTLEKGVMRITFDAFNPTQLTCMIRNFSNINHLSEANESCFGGMLVEPAEHYGE
jgi:hypothetical protein